MEVYITDSELNDIMMLDETRSIIWHSVYCGEGDFELYVPADYDLFQVVQEGQFVYRDDSSTVMIIEKIASKTTVENEDFLIISGKSAEGILARRVVWRQTNLNGRVSEQVMRLIWENVTDPEERDRKITQINLGTAAVPGERIQRQLYGEDILSCCTELLASCGLGFGFRKNVNSLDMNIICGADRSEGNTEGNDEVVFSEEFDNLTASEYIRDFTEYKNVVLVAGEGEGTARKWQVSGQASGLARRETYVESGASSNNEEISQEDYFDMLVADGTAALLEMQMSEKFNGEVIPDANFVLGRDYFLGDIVTIKNRYGISAKVRVTDITENKDENGYTLIISYESIGVGKENEI